MFGTIVISVLVTALGMTTLFLCSEHTKMKREILKLSRENENLSGELHDRSVRKAYNKGLYDGRTTDAIYRKLLEKKSAGEQATVIMRGEV